MGHERITLDDTVQSAIAKVCEGNLGALRVCCEMATHGGPIDPDAALGGFSNVLSLDSHGIYGPQVWMLYKHVCGESLVHTIAALRAVQLGLLSESVLLHAIENNGEGVDPENVLTSVREHLPNFAPGAPAQAEA